MNYQYPWQFASRRSAVMAPQGAVATSNPLAANVGLRVLEDGGSAADAAVAAAAMLNVVEPHMTGIGGDVFALTYFDGEYRALNASGWAPSAATRDRYRDVLDGSPGAASIPEDGGLPVTVPGAVAGWEELVDRYGRRSFGALLQPAVEYARRGVPVSEYVATEWARQRSRVSDFERTGEVFGLAEGSPTPGDRFANPALADTLEQLATEGRSVMYGGDLGQRVVETVREHGGFLSIEDLAAYECGWGEPLETTYRGLTVLEHPPNGQGAIALEALNIAERFDLNEDPTDPERLHRLIEATKMAFADGYAHVADPQHVDVPVETMVSKEYAARRAGELGESASRHEHRIPDGDTTAYLAVVDADGNGVSFINSNYSSFGSGLTVGGFVLQNRGRSFSLDPDHANCLAPRKRPFHTIIPAMLREGNRFAGAFGVIGGPMQPQGHLQLVANLVDSELNPQAALDAPRFRYLDGNEVALETSRLPGDTVETLRERGHIIVDEDEYFRERDGHWGGGQLVTVAEDGTLIAGSDPRKDGQAVGY